MIYLPGLGEASEASEAGERWRTAWARAGYAVMSIQVLDDDAGAWRSDLARTGEFKALARQRYAGVAMARRVQRLTEAVTEARRRSAVSEAPWQSLDWNSLAIAGYDLGAYTSMAVAGERIRDAEAAAGQLPVRAAVAFSPYANISEGGIETRYRDIRVPVLSVSSDVDGDVLGLVEGASMRDLPFSHMDGPDKYLLLLRGLSHVALGGRTDTMASMAAESASRPTGDARQSGASDTALHRRGRQGAVGGAGNVARDSSAGDGRAREASLTPTELQLRLIAVEDVSTAFLDAYLRNSAQARQWLAADASRWLGAGGDLRRR